MMDELLRYFPDLSPAQRERFAAMGPLYAQWNARINVISRQDTEHFYLHHVLHSLAIARVVITAREGKEGLFVSRLDLFSDDEDDEE